MTTATAVCFDADLMRRYDREGPRYTSYPTAMQFRDGIEAGDYERAAAASVGANEGLPLSLYVHIPFCLSPCFYCGCNKIVTRRPERADDYVRRLLCEIGRRSAYFGRSRTVEQMHFGGGTPTFLPRQLLIELIDRIDREFQLTDARSRDYSIEIDPRGVDGGMLRLLAALGFNRISLGVQDFDENVQQAVNRIQPAETVARVYGQARDLGFSSINFDLIYGLPRQTQATFAATLDRVIDLRPDRLAVYGYAHMPRLFKAQRQIRTRELPDPAARLGLLQLAVEKLCAAGYVYIGMDHFALPGDGLATARRDGTLHRNFQGYTTHANRDLVSLGVSAIGRVGDLYVQNHKLLGDYEAAVDRGALPSCRGVRMSRDDVVRKDVIHDIMCNGSIDVATVERRHGIRFDGYFADELDRLRGLQADGLVELGNGRIVLTPAGRLLMRSVAMTFDAYLSTERASERGSRVI
ncbi:MAG: oxygen-independent coproporphyrinogen III oxidase [Steroidobacteraceae bacterium]|jgi:oxygen-independent coproporphyrinogen-3 oxidase